MRTIVERLLTLAGVAAVSLAVSARANPAAALPAEDPEALLRGHLPADLPIRPVADRPHELAGRQTHAVVRRLRPDRDGRRVPQQAALAGKTIYLSPGHGWVHTGSGWVTQRGATHGLVEDLSNVDGVGQFLVPYLLRAGAHVVPLREIDPSQEMVILDDGDADQSPGRGIYRESGDPAAFSNSALTGWGHPALPLAAGTAPFSLGGNRLMSSAATETARATFIPSIPRSGYYYVYVSYSMYKQRASDARFIVVHPGGEAHFLVDQRRHGGTWVLLGRFFFLAGTDETLGAVVVTNASDDAGSNISVDAVRLGGGGGLLARGGAVSGQPRTDEGCRYHAQFSGAPASVYDFSTGDDRIDDVAARARFADWLHAPGEPAAFVSYHSNAFDGAIRGTETYVHGSNPPNGSFTPSSASLALGSGDLGRAVHQRLIADLRAAHDPGWTDRGLRSAYFGELNPAHQDEMPATLVEVAFHDHPEDAAALRDGEFRRLVARGIGKGLIEFFAARQGAQPVFPPEPPGAVVARGGPSGTVTISWDAPPTGGALGDAAVSYRVYRAAQGRGYAFDEGVDTGGATTWTVSGLLLDRVHYFRVAAVNAGGESAPSPTLAVGLATAAAKGASSGPGRLLLVTGFDRLDETLNLQVSHGGDLGTVQRLLVERMNNGTYLVQHGEALAATGYAFDAATHDAVGAHYVALADYQLVLWQAGRGLRGGSALDPVLAHALRQAWQAGVSLVISGSEVARSLASDSASAVEQALLAEVLHVTHVGVDSLDQVFAAGGGLFEGLAPWYLAGSGGEPYVALPSDALGVTDDDSQPAALYAGGGVAAVQRVLPGQCAVLLGFPLEAVIPAAHQAELVERLLDGCALAVATPDAAMTDGAADARSTGADAGLDDASGGTYRLDASGSGMHVLEGGCRCDLPGSAVTPAWLLLLLLLRLLRGPAAGAPAAGSAAGAGAPPVLAVRRRRPGRRSG